MSKVKIGLLVGLLIASVSGVYGESVKVKAKGYVPNAGWRISQKERNQAVKEAKQNALKVYGSKIDNSARFELYESLLPAMYKDLDKYVISFSVVHEGKNDATKAYEIFVEASLDSNQIEREIQRKSPTSNSGAMSQEEASDLVFIFVGRRVSAITTSDGKRVDFSETKTQGHETESVAANSGGVTTGYDASDMKVTEYGGKKIDKAQSIEWAAEPISSVDSAVNEVFSKANYSPVDPRDVEGLDLSLFVNDYSTGDDVSSATRRETISLLRDYEVPYFATGRLDILLADEDPVTGMSRVFVRVSAKITSLKKRLPKTVAAIRSVQYQGLGSSPMVAEQNALNNAAERAAQDLVDQLRSKGVR